jgi:hypothetical protein
MAMFGGRGGCQIPRADEEGELESVNGFCHWEGHQVTGFFFFVVLLLWLSFVSFFYVVIFLIWCYGFGFLVRR